MAKEKNKFYLIKRFWAFALNNWKKFYSIATGEKQENPRRFLFLYFSWIVFLLFLSLSFLVEKSPFTLLLPFQVFSLPVDDPRTMGVIYVSDGEANIYASDRKIFLQNNVKEDVREIIEEVGRPPHFSAGFKEGDPFFGAKLKKLPNLSIALISVWLVDDGEKAIIDFSSSELEKELAKFRFAKSKIEEAEEDEAELMDTESYYSPPSDFIDAKTLKEIEEKKVLILGLALKAIQQSILANITEVEKLEFRLDGKKDNFIGFFKPFSEI